MIETIKRDELAGTVTVTADDGTVRTWTIAEWEEDSARCIAATGNGFLRAVPQEIDAAQAETLLHRLGLMPAVNALLADPQTPEEIRIFWRRQGQFSRTSPALNAMAALLGLSQEQLDDMFRAAAQIAV